MRPPTLLAAALLASALVLVLAPGAGAIDPCTTADPECPAFVCAHYSPHTQDRDACIGERFHCYDGPCSLPIDP